MSTSTTRERMIETADRLFRRHGYHATSWRTLVEESGTPWGSIQHHFPGGKEELAVAAIEVGHAQALSYREHWFERADSVPAGIRLWFEKVASALERSGWELGCPIATVALETVNASPALAETCAHAFDVSQRSLAKDLRAAGIAPARARELAMLIFATFEGALILARAARSQKPLQLAGKQFEALLADELRALDR
jgi:TetR/AcrR family transcriptional repressor of lmrAB and yxaGH operons